MDTTTDRSVAKLTEKTWAVFLGDEQIGTIERGKGVFREVESVSYWDPYSWSYTASSLDLQEIGCPYLSLEQAADQLVSWFTADELHGNKV